MYVHYIVFVLTLTRIIKSVVTAQAPSHSGAEEYPSEKTQTKGGTHIYVVHTYITADAIHASTRNM